MGSVPGQWVCPRISLIFLRPICLKHPPAHPLSHHYVVPALSCSILLRPAVPPYSPSWACRWPSSGPSSTSSTHPCTRPPVPCPCSAFVFCPAALPGGANGRALARHPLQVCLCPASLAPLRPKRARHPGALAQGEEAVWPWGVLCILWMFGGAWLGVCGLGLHSACCVVVCEQGWGPWRGVQLCAPAGAWHRVCTVYLPQVFKSSQLLGMPPPALPAQHPSPACCIPSPAAGV